MFKWIKDLFKKKENKDCNEEIGILDIRNNFIYTDNDYVISGLKIHSINTQLLSKAESKSLIRDLSAEISSEKEEMKYFTISRTVDITSLQEEIKQKIEDSDNVIRKNLLKNHLTFIPYYDVFSSVELLMFEYSTLSFKIIPFLYII